MELVLEWDEIDDLLRAALKDRDIKVPAHAEMIIRRNNKGEHAKARLVYKTRKVSSRESPT